MDRMNVPCKACGKDRWLVKYAYNYQAKLPRYTGLCRKCATKLRLGEKHQSWKGGKIRVGGYVLIKLLPDDFFYPMANSQRYVSEHRLVVAKHLNRCLLPWEVVHHKNGIRDDNRTENLALLPHSKFHLIDLHTKSYIKALEKQIKKLEDEVCFLTKKTGS